MTLLACVLSRLPCKHPVMTTSSDNLFVPEAAASALDAAGQLPLSLLLGCRLSAVR